jgi:hypothetical protein
MLRRSEKMDCSQWLPVIASEAKQSNLFLKKTGLFRGFLTETSL